MPPHFLELRCALTLGVRPDARHLAFEPFVGLAANAIELGLVGGALVFRLAAHTIELRLQTRVGISPDARNFILERARQLRLAILFFLGP